MPHLRQFPTVSPAPGVTRQVLSETPEIMVVAFTFEAGATGALHSHPHLQSTYVETGLSTFEIAGAHLEAGPDDSFVIPPDARHGCTCLAPGRLIDFFTPRRDDFL